MATLKLLLVCVKIRIAAQWYVLRALDIMAVRVSQDQPYFLLCGKDVADQVLLQIRGEAFKFYATHPTEHCLHVNDISPQVPSQVWNEHALKQTFTLHIQCCKVSPILWCASWDSLL